MSPLITILLGLAAQFGPVLVKDVATLIHGNPKLATETDADYVARIGALIDTNTANVVAQDAEIQKP